MLRLLGIVFLLIICVDTAPWGLVAGAAFCILSFLSRRTPTSKDRLWCPDKLLSVTDAGRSLLTAIPLVNAVYCVNCDVITNSPHDECGVCGSHSVISVSRMWQIAVPEAPIKAARYKVSFTAEVTGIPAYELSESTKLIGRLAEMGGDVRSLHIQVDALPAGEAIAGQSTRGPRKPPGRVPIPEWQHSGSSSDAIASGNNITTTTYAA